MRTLCGGRAQASLAAERRLSKAGGLQSLALPGFSSCGLQAPGVDSAVWHMGLVGHSGVESSGACLGGQCLPLYPREAPSPDLMINFIALCLDSLFCLVYVCRFFCLQLPRVSLKKTKNGVVWLPHVGCALCLRGSLPWPTDSLWCLGCTPRHRYSVVASRGLGSSAV